MSKPICYAIMPYGGENEALQNHFAEVFQLYIKTPAEASGYNVIREDYDGKNGPIPASIIKHIAESDLVIADVSTVGESKQPNFNVAYELGIRHAMTKRGTILIRNADDNESAFDVRQLKTIKYGRTLLATQQEIQSAISKLQNQSEADNEVHTVYPNFIDRMVDYLDGRDSRFTAVQDDNNRLRNENSRLQGMLNKMGISTEGTQNDDMDISKSIGTAMESIQYSGKKLLVTLQQELGCASPDYNKVALYLERGLTIGQLSKSDFRRLYAIFKESELPQLTSLILEVATRRYPTSLDFKSYLADVYSDTYETWDKAQKYANEVLKVYCDADGHYHADCHKIDDDQLAACFNAYIGMNKYDVIVDVGTELLETIPDHCELILRNLAVAYFQTDQSEKEIRIIQRLIAEYPISDLNHYRLAAYYIRKGNYIQAYYQLELACALDMNDVDYMFMIAGFIIDRKIARVGGKVRSDLSREESVNWAIPFIYQGFNISNTAITLQRCQEFLLRNSLRTQAEDFLNWIQTKSFPEGLNSEALDHINELSSNLREDYCKQLEII